MAYEIGLVESITVIDARLTTDTIYHVVTNSATPFEIYRFTPALNEKGYAEFNYLAVDANGAGIIKKKLGQYRKSNTGIVTGSVSNILSPAGDTGMTTPDFNLAVVGGDVIFSVTGVASKDVRHSLEIIINKLTLDL